MVAPKAAGAKKEKAAECESRLPSSTLATVHGPERRPQPHVCGTRVCAMILLVIGDRGSIARRVHGVSRHVRPLPRNDGSRAHLHSACFPSQPSPRLRLSRLRSLTVAPQRPAPTRLAALSGECAPICARFCGCTGSAHYLISPHSPGPPRYLPPHLLTCSFPFVSAAVHVAHEAGVADAAAPPAAAAVSLTATCPARAAARKSPRRAPVAATGAPTKMR